MSRSCQSATFSTPTCALPRRTRARPQIRSQTTGLRLCGIALEPFWPARNGSSTSRTSVRCRCRISVAKRSSPAPHSAIARQQLRMAVARDDLGRDVLVAQAERRHHALLVVRAERRVGADRAGDRARDLPERALQPLGVAVGLHRVARELEAERGRLGVHAVGAAHAQRARMLARLLRQLPGQLRARPGRAARPLAAAAAPSRCRRRRRTSARSGSSAPPAPRTPPGRRRTPPCRGRGSSRAR